MFQVRIHGRGGQGVVSAAELLSVAAFLDGRHAQAFPSFGSERMGAPVMAFCRIDDREIRLREPVMEPDALLIQDPTLLHQVDLFQGLTKGGYVLINSTRTPGELGLGPLLATLPAGHLRAVPATDLARRLIGRPMPNTALCGGFAALTGQVTLASLRAAICERFSGALGDANAAAATAAYEFVHAEHTGAGEHAQTA